MTQSQTQAPGQEGRSKKLAKEFGISSSGVFFGRAISAVTQLVLAASLGASGFGLFAITFSIIRIGDLIGRCGLDTGSLRFVAVHRNSALALRYLTPAATAISGTVSTAIAVIIFLSASLLDRRFAGGHGVLTMGLRLSVLFLPAISLLWITTALTRGTGQTRYTAIARDVVQPSVQLALIGLFLVLHRLTPTTAILSYAASFLPATLLARHFVRGLGSRGVVAYRRVRVVGANLLSYSWPLLLTSSLQFLITWLDTLILAAFAAPREVGIYRAAGQLTMLFPMLLSASNSVVGPLTARALRNGDAREAKELLTVSSRWLFYLCIPLALVVFVMPRQTLRLLGPEYVAGTQALMLLTCAQLVAAVTAGVGQTLTLTGLQRLELFNSGVLLVANAVLSLTLIPRYGVIGAAWASAVSIGGVNILRSIQVWRAYGYHAYDQTFVPGLLAAAAAGAICFLLQHHVSGLFGLAGALLLTTVTFGTVLLLIGPPHDDAVLLRSAVGKFRRKKSAS